MVEKLGASRLVDENCEEMRKRHKGEMKNGGIHQGDINKGHFPLLVSRLGR